jgi:hypothetical protein
MCSGTYQHFFKKIIKEIQKNIEENEHQIIKSNIE